MLVAFGALGKCPAHLALGFITAKGDSSQLSPEACKARLLRKKVQSIKTPPSYQESLARDWDRLSQDMLSVLMCKEQGPLVCLALQMAQQARVGTRSPLSRGPMAQALTSPLDSSLEPPAWAGKPELEGRWQQEFAPSKARRLTLGYKSG